MAKQQRERRGKDREKEREKERDEFEERVVHLARTAKVVKGDTCFSSVIYHKTKGTGKFVTVGFTLTHR